MKKTVLSYDVIVAGGGIAGLAAAVKASRTGVKTLLIEQYGFTGGSATAGMVSPFMKHTVHGIPLTKGIFQELEEGMIRRNGMIDNGFSGIAFRLAAFELLRKAGVDILPNAVLMNATLTDRSLQSVDVLYEGTVYTIQGTVFIDTTGDAQLVYLAGLPYEKGEDGRLQSMTLFFRMGNINIPRALDYINTHRDNFFEWMDYNFNLNKIISVGGYFSFVKKAHREGRLSDHVKYIFYTTLPHSGEASFNTSNILELDGTRSEDMTRAEIEGRRQVMDVVHLLQTKIPGFEKAWLLETAAQVGIRETRRIVGDYVMTGRDVLEGRKFEDMIARASYGIDIHGAKGESDRMEELKEGDFYTIPFRSLIHRNAENVLSAGRCLSATREGHAAIRIMPTSAATGEAAGAAAGLSVADNIPLRSLSYGILREQIRHNIEFED
jgi:hypothetical protein